MMDLWLFSGMKLRTKFDTIQAAAQEAYEKAYKEAEKEKEIALKEAAIEGKLESARNFKKSGVSAEIISKCTGLSLQQVQEL